MADGGMHKHGGVDRKAMTTSLDGEHTHVFELPDGTIVETEPGGRHSHVMYSEKSNHTTAGGTHAHKIKLPGFADDEIAFVEMDGWHEHELGVDDVPEGGVHSHALYLPQGGVIFSKTPGDLAKKKGDGKRKYKKGAERKREMNDEQFEAAASAGNQALAILKSMRADEVKTSKADDWSWANADDLAPSQIPSTNPLKKIQ